MQLLRGDKVIDFLLATVDWRTEHVGFVRETLIEDGLVEGNRLPGAQLKALANLRTAMVRRCRRTLAIVRTRAERYHGW